MCCLWELQNVYTSQLVRNLFPQHCIKPEMGCVSAAQLELEKDQRIMKKDQFPQVRHLKKAVHKHHLLGIE